MPTSLPHEETIELVLPSRIESVEQAAQAAADLVTRAELGDDAAFGIDLAVREAVTNAVLHGNRQDPAKQVEVRLVTSAAGFEIFVRDFGAGFIPAAVPDPTDDDNLLKTSGRGMLFIRTFMDDVEWVIPTPGGGTLVHMTKKRTASATG